MAKFEVSAYGARGDGLAFERGDHMLDVGWGRSFDQLGDAVAFAKTRKTGWAYTDDCDWRRRGAKFLHLVEYGSTGQPLRTYRFDVTAPWLPNAEIRYAQ